MDILKRIPAKYRQWIYGIGTFALAVYAIWEATNHDWKAFTIALVTGAVTTLATANTDPSQPAA